MPYVLRSQTLPGHPNSVSNDSIRTTPTIASSNGSNKLNTKAKAKVNRNSATNEIIKIQKNFIEEIENDSRQMETELDELGMIEMRNKELERQMRLKINGWEKEILECGDEGQMVGDMIMVGKKDEMIIKKVKDLESAVELLKCEVKIKNRQKRDLKEKAHEKAELLSQKQKERCKPSSKCESINWKTTMKEMGVKSFRTLGAAKIVTICFTSNQTDQPLADFKIDSERKSERKISNEFWKHLSETYHDDICNLGSTSTS